MTKNQKEYSKRECAILFGDVQGFSKLHDAQPKLFLQHVLPLIATALHGGGPGPVEANTWGDGFVAFFGACSEAAMAALALRDEFNKFRWSENSLPKLRIRLALHAGEVYQGYDPVRNRSGMIGVEINRAARIEPIVEPNHVYATEEFTRRCKAEGVAFHDLGSMELAKAWGDDHLYAVTWDGEHIDTSQLITKKAPPLSLDPITLFGQVKSSRFAKRLGVNSEAKTAIAKYCMGSDFWRSDDAVFIESGTIPVYLVTELLMSDRDEQQPRLIITNNIAVSLASTLSRPPESDTNVLHPEDVLSRVLLLGGTVLDDYAATIPGDLLPEHSPVHYTSQDVFDTWQANAITHMVMMTRSFSPTAGPRAVSLGMRRFKKLMLKYVAESETARLTIVAEGDKLLRDDGEPVDAVDLAIDCESTSYWTKVRGSGRATLITAPGPAMHEADKGYIRKQLSYLMKAGMKCVFVGDEPEMGIAGEQP